MSKQSLMPPQSGSASDQSSSSTKKWCSFCPDLLKIAGLTMVPMAVSTTGWYLFPPSREQIEWYDNLEKPWFSIKNNNVSIALETASVLPIGYALFLCTKSGNETASNAALSSFGVAMALNLGASYVFGNVKNTACWLGSSTMLLGSAVVTQGAFCKADKTAGILMTPFVLWLTYQTVEMVGIYLVNSEKPKKPKGIQRKLGSRRMRP